MKRYTLKDRPEGMNYGVPCGYTLKNRPEGMSCGVPCGYKILVLAVVFTCMLSGCAGNPSEKGLEYLEKGNYKEAQEQFEKAIEKDKNAGDAYRGIGIAKWEQQDYEGAKEAFEEALDHGADKTGTIYNFLGSCQMQLSDPDSALNYYRLAETSEGNSKKLAQEIQFNMIAAYEKTGDWESAKAMLADYTAQYPEDEQAAKEAEFLETR